MGLSGKRCDILCLFYMQVVTLVLYTYFIAALLGRQMIPRRDDTVPLAKYEDPDLYFPLFTALQVSLNRGRKKQKHFSPIQFYHRSKLNCLKKM